LPRRLFLATHERTEVHSREVARSSLSPLASGPGVHFEEWLASGPTRALAAKPGGGQRAGKPSRSPLLRRARRLGSVRAGKPPGLPSRAERVERPLPLCGSGIARLGPGGKSGRQHKSASHHPAGRVVRPSRRVAGSTSLHRTTQWCDRSPLTVKGPPPGGVRHSILWGSPLLGPREDPGPSDPGLLEGRILRDKRAPFWSLEEDPGPGDPGLPGSY